MSYHLTDKLIARTRKPHRCVWCGEPIEAGSRARFCSGVYEGYFYSDDYHPECSHAWQSVAREWDYEFDPWRQARGRTDDNADAGSMFTPEGERIEAVEVQP